MKTITILLITASGLAAQTPVNSTILVKPGQKINMHFDYPELIKVSTWDKNEISITGSVSINQGESDDAFTLDINTTDDAVSIDSYIKNMKNLPQRITVTQNGKKIMFNTKADYKKYAEETGKDYSHMSWGVDVDILLEIKVPRNTETKIESVYGMVEVKNFIGALQVEATYGGIDAALQEQSTGELIAETNYGQIYTNLAVKFNNQDLRDENFHTYVAARPGTGPRYSFESKYGNVYLRKSNGFIFKEK